MHDPSERRPIVDLTDEQARRALRLKWGSVPHDVLPAWVAEMDYAVDPVVMEAVQRALADGVTGYPLERDPELGTSYAAWADRHFGWAPSPEEVLEVVDVTAGVRVAIDVLSTDWPASPVVASTCWRFRGRPSGPRSTSSGSTACSPTARRH